MEEDYADACCLPPLHILFVLPHTRILALFAVVFPYSGVLFGEKTLVPYEKIRVLVS